MSQCRQNYAAESEAAVNKQINLELYAHYVYLSMSYYFQREDVNLPGFAKYFKKSSNEEQVHAEMMMKFQNDRGGRIVLQSVPKPDRDEWGSALEALQIALNLEKNVNQSLLDMHSIAAEHHDPHMGDWIEETFLVEQVEDQKELADHITQLKRVGSGLGEYIYDKETIGEKLSDFKILEFDHAH